MRHPLTEGHTGLPEMDCPLITSEHSSRILREESHDFNRGRSQNPTVLNKSFKQVFVNRLFNGIPSFETVRRCRTKVQSEHEELHSTLEVKQKRKKARRVFIEWAKI